MGRKKSAKRITWIFGALAAVITTVLISAYTFRPANISYKSVKAGTGSISTYYYFSGNVIAKNRQTILSEKMTQISKVLIKEGETVGINEVLMTTIGGDKIKSGIGGEIVKIYIQENEQVMPGTRLVDIVDYDHIEIAFKVDEYDVGALAVGKEAIAKIGAAGKDIKGKISDISREGQIINGVTLFTATMDIDKDEDIRIGMSAEVKLLSERAENVVIIPMNVILFDEKNQPYVLKTGNRNTVVREKITTGIHDGTFVEVKSGVEAGETILYRKDDSLEHLLFPEGGKNVHFGGIME